MSHIYVNIMDLVFLVINISSIAHGNRYISRLSQARCISVFSSSSSSSFSIFHDNPTNMTFVVNKTQTNSNVVVHSLSESFSPNFYTFIHRNSLILYYAATTTLTLSGFRDEQKSILIREFCNLIMIMCKK